MTSVTAAERDRLRLRAVPITKIVRSGVSFDIAGGILILVLLPVMAAVVGF